MADNLLWLRGQYPDSRIVLWAHNGHISKADDRLGRWLQDRLGADYVNFGFTFYRGRCSITVPDSEELQHDVQTARPARSNTCCTSLASLSLSSTCGRCARSRPWPSNGSTG